MTEDLINRITYYLSSGGLFNPELADHLAVRNLLMECREALAQPEQERFLVATIGNWGRVEWADGVFPSLGDKMYSAPRTWVGLTDEEKSEIKKQANYNWETTAGEYASKVQDLTEAKLRSKND